MKITLPVHYLREVVSTLAPLAKKTMFIGAHALNGRVQLTATGPEVSAQASVDCDVGQVGAALLPALLTSQALSTLPDADVTIKTTTKGLLIKCGRSEFEWQTPQGEVPPLVNDDDGPSCTLDGSGLSTCLDRVEFYSKGASHASYALEGVHVSFKDGHLYCVTVGKGGGAMAVAATLARCDHDDWSCQIPRDSVQVLRRMLKVGPCTFSPRGNHVIITCNPYLIQCQLLAGKFPDWRKMLPDNPKPKIIIPSEEIVSAMKQVGMAGEADTARVKFELGAKSLIISRTSNTGNVVVEIPVGDHDRTAVCYIDHTKLMPAIQHAPKGMPVSVHVPNDNPGDTDSFDVEYPGARYYIGTMST